MSEYGRSMFDDGNVRFRKGDGRTGLMYWMAQGDGYVMVRHKDRAPFVITEGDWDECEIYRPEKPRRPARIHVLNILPEFFDAIVDGTKTFEVRRNDRDFRVGDTLVLRRYDPMTREQFRDESGCIPRAQRLVTYILEGDSFGIDTGYVVMGLK